jgi:hypothetical protein
VTDYVSTLHNLAAGNTYVLGLYAPNYYAYYYDSCDFTAVQYNFSIKEIQGCPSEMTGDGLIDINDFIQFNSAFGNSCTNCPEDLSGDGMVDVNDFLILNSSFGQPCP